MDNVYDSIAEEWNEYRQKPRPLFKLLLRHAQGGVCLDLGTGNGRHLPLLSKKYKKVFAVDNSLKLLEIAEKNHLLPNVEFKTGDCLTLPFESEFFDDVYVIAMLHHLNEEEVSAGFEEICRVLKPGGLLIGTVWNKFQEKFLNSPKVALVNWKKKNGEVVKRLYNFIQRKEVETMPGFEVVEIFYEKNGKKVEKQGAHNLCFVLRKV